MAGSRPQFSLSYGLVLELHVYLSREVGSSNEWPAENMQPRNQHSCRIRGEEDEFDC